MRESYSVIKHLLRTEKGTEMSGKNKYLFCVDLKANKIEIRRAIEDIFKVKVAKVNTIKVHGKKKRIRYKEGYTGDWKKAVVTLKEGKIEVA